MSYITRQPAEFKMAAGGSDGRLGILRARGQVMRPFHEATKHAELMEFAGRKYVAVLKISRQSPKVMLLRKYSMSLHGPIQA